LDYTVYTNVVGLADFFDKLRGWCISHGWTEEEWIPEVTWATITGTGAWRSYSDGGFLQMSKTGYGTQNLIVSLACVAREAFGAHGINGSMRSQLAYEANYFGAQENPICQNAIAGPPVSCAENLFYSLGNNTGGFDVGRSSLIPKVWFFAGPHWICVVTQMNSVYSQMMHFGSFEMYEDNPSQGQVFGLSTQNLSVKIGSTYYDNWAWSVYPSLSKAVIPFSTGYVGSFGYDWIFGSYFYYHSRTENHTYDNIWRMRDNCNIDETNYGSESNLGIPVMDLGPAVKANHYSEKRPLLKPVYYISHPVENGPLDNVWQPICRAPVWCTRFSGLQIGSELTYGSEKYLVFPARTVNSTYGYAFRIA
jgi:hypothetical protein